MSEVSKQVKTGVAATAVPAAVDTAKKSGADGSVGEAQEQRYKDILKAKQTCTLLVMQPNKPGDAIKGSLEQSACNCMAGDSNCPTKAVLHSL